MTAQIRQPIWEDVALPAQGAGVVLVAVPPNALMMWLQGEIAMDGEDVDIQMLDGAGNPMLSLPTITVVGGVGLMLPVSRPVGFTFDAAHVELDAVTALAPARTMRAFFLVL